MSKWETKNLGEVIKLEYGKPLPKDCRDEGGKYPVYGANGVKCWSNQYYLDKQSIIVGRKGSAGEVNLTTEKCWPLDVTYFVTYDDTQYDPSFLYHCLKYLRLIRLAKGVKPGLNRNDVYQIEFAFPLLPEQKRIVAILDEAFEGIDRAIANTEKNLANTRELFESYLNAIFTHKGDGWVESNLGAVCKFQGGSQPPKSVFSPEKKEGYIRLIQIRDYKSDKYLVYIPKAKAKRFCKPDDVMIGRYGPPLFQILRGLEGAYNVALMKAVPNEEFLSKDFLFYFLKNRNILHYIISSSSRTAGQTGLNKATIEPYPIAFPTLEKQAIIVAQLQELKAETQRLEAIYRQKLVALKELKQSILQKAFTGELNADTPKTVKEKIAA